MAGDFRWQTAFLSACVQQVLDLQANDVVSAGVAIPGVVQLPTGHNKPIVDTNGILHPSRVVARLRLRLCSR